jgi:hypothetical protein
LHRTQAITFLIAIQLGLFAALLIASCADLPVLLFGYQVWWLCGVLVPLLSATLIFSPSVGHLMKLMPGACGWCEGSLSNWFMCHFLCEQ